MSYCPGTECGPALPVTVLVIGTGISGRSFDDDPGRESFWPLLRGGIACDPVRIVRYMEAFLMERICLGMWPVTPEPFGFAFGGPLTLRASAVAEHASHLGDESQAAGHTMATLLTLNAGVANCVD